VKLQKTLHGRMNDAFILGVLNKMEETYGLLQRATDRRMARLFWLQRITDLAEDGQIAIITWSRDCDHVCGESRFLVEATAKAVDARIERDLAWADGPMSHRLAAPSEPFQGWSRDMAAEAFEDGHPHSVSDTFSPWEF